MSAPPGWYPDPLYMGRERYWTGTAWADESRPLQPHRHPPPEQPQTQPLPISGPGDRPFQEQQPLLSADEPAPDWSPSVPVLRAHTEAVEQPVAQPPKSTANRRPGGRGGGLWPAVVTLAAVVPRIVGALGIVVPIAYGLNLVWGPRAAAIPFVVWLAAGPVLLARPVQRWVARAVQGCREPDASEHGRLAEPWQRVQRRAGVRAGGYRLMVLESEDLNACTAMGRVVAVTSSSAGGSLPAERLEAVLAHELGHRLGWRSGLDYVNTLVMLPIWTLWRGLRALWIPVAPMYRRAVAWHRPIGFLLTFLLALTATVISVVAAVPAVVAYAVVRVAGLSAGLRESDADAFAVRLGLGPELLAAQEEHIEAAHLHPHGGKPQPILLLIQRAGRLRRRLADQGVSP